MSLSVLSVKKMKKSLSNGGVEEEKQSFVVAERNFVRDGSAGAGTIFAQNWSCDPDFG